MLNNLLNQTNLRLINLNFAKTIVLNVLTKNKAKGIYWNLPSGVFVCIL